MFGYRSHTLGLLKSKGRSAQEEGKKRSGLEIV